MPGGMDWISLRDGVVRIPPPTHLDGVCVVRPGPGHAGHAGHAATGHARVPWLCVPSEWTQVGLVIYSLA